VKRISPSSVAGVWGLRPPSFLETPCSTSQAKEMQKYLEQNKRKYHQTKPMKAYKMADEFGKGYEAIEMQKAMKK
jgi:hypothetical protein